ncbi:hypothetical protein IFM89_011340 [Coptis chinensis]|uniref:Uncharacterized protein n=1 Tax=Coptis chinensis TaxID=261450 RepID=A0A835M9M5_9MAGN|nr:hypothetical protein IFM89_011340 [Coptis chinensis]
MFLLFDSLEVVMMLHSLSHETVYCYYAYGTLLKRLVSNELLILRSKVYIDVIDKKYLFSLYYIAAIIHSYCILMTQLVTRCILLFSWIRIVHIYTKYFRMSQHVPYVRLYSF